MINISGLETFDTGSNYPFNNQQSPASVPKDLFNLSHLHTTTIDNAGQVIPIALIKTVPGDSFDISVSSLLRVLPQVVPLYSRQRGYIHAFYARYSDLFDYAPTYMTKGYNGTTVMQKPYMTAENMGSYWTKKIASGDLLNYLGLPIGFSPSEIDSTSGHINILPAFMYWKIVNQYYRNKNTQLNDRVRLPDDFADLRLNRQNDLISNSNANYNADSNPSGTKKQTFGSLEYRDWSADYFTSGFPSQQRGDAVTLKGSVSGLQITGVVKNVGSGSSNLVNGSAAASITGASGFGLAAVKTSSSGPATSADSWRVTGPTTTSSVSFTPGAKSVTGSVNVADIASKITSTIDTSISSGVDFGITLENIRSMAIAQDELERMAKTDGTFSAFGSVFFGVSSRNALDYVVQYIGGSYQSINFSEVVQSSSSTDSSPLGNYAGHGISSQTNGYLGHIDCDEHGYIMVLFSVMPDTYYCQGIDQDWFQLLQDEEFLPEREKMGLVPVYTRELYFSTDKNGSEVAANSLFVYQSPFDNLRYMNNHISGKIADKDSLSFFPYTQARFFDSVPRWNSDFLLAKDVRKDYLSAPTEVAYTAQFDFNIRAVRPLPFYHSPAQVIN